jgi:site-specific DNA-methyltransferase (cytosine-N4-specific)
MTADERRHWAKSPWSVFYNRLAAALEELANCRPLLGSCLAIRDDARHLLSGLTSCNEQELFDLVITSPPYGDSRTTLQYGGMSGLSLGVLRHVKALRLDAIRGVEIDRLCLGGESVMPAADSQLAISQKIYWHGGQHNRASSRATAFARDLEKCCRQVGSVLRKGGHAVFVVARRSAGGWRVYLDSLIVKLMYTAGVQFVRGFVRQIPHKVTPFMIHRRARAKSNTITHRDFVPTMREEFVLVFRRV